MHPRRLTLERFFVDDLPAADRAQTEAHLWICDSCRAAVREMEADRAAMLVTHPPANLVDRVKAAAPRKRAPARFSRLLLVGAAGCAAIVVAMLVRPSSPEEIAFKGASVTVGRIRGGQLELLRSDTRVRSDDALRLTVRVSTTALVQAWFLDSDGRLDEVLAAPMRLGPGEHVLPGTSVVESPCRDMVLALASASSGETLPSNEAIRTMLVSGEADGLFVTRVRCE